MKSFNIPLQGSFSAVGPAELQTSFLLNQLAFDKAVRLNKIYCALYVTNAAGVRRLPKFWEVNIYGAGSSYIERENIVANLGVGCNIATNLIYAGFEPGFLEMDFSKVDARLEPSATFNTLTITVYDTLVLNDQINYYILVNGEMIN